MKTVSDPVYGTISLTDIEVEIVSTKVFQRLRRVSQLGLADMVFPSAGFSRFSHSLGTCHAVGLVLDAVCGKHRSLLTKRERQLYRLAGLLHDLGHYPFSHILEHAVREAYTRRNIIKKPDEITTSTGSDPWLTHEELSHEIALNDPEIVAILKRAKIDAHDIWSLINGLDVFGPEKRPVPIRNVISADLDADRIDYMLRTHHHSGLPYGFVDLDYLLTQLDYDSEKRMLVLSEKALAAVDHMLVNRYLNYQQMPYNKAVAGLEMALERVLCYMIESDRVDLTPAALMDAILGGSWHTYDEEWLRALMRALQQDATAPGWARDLASCVLDRRPPKLVVERTEFKEIGDAAESARDYDARMKQVEVKLSDAADAIGTDKERLLLWGRQIKLTKMPRRVTMSQLEDEQNLDELKDKALQLVHVMTKDGPRPVVDNPRSLLKVLSEHYWESMRLYLVPDDWTDQAAAEQSASALEYLRREAPGGRL